MGSHINMLYVQILCPNKMESCNSLSHHSSSILGIQNSYLGIDNFICTYEGVVLKTLLRVLYAVICYGLKVKFITFEFLRVRWRSMYHGLNAEVIYLRLYLMVLRTFSLGSIVK